eukprot:689387_1
MSKLMSSNKHCRGCQREFSVFIRPYSCELCNQSKLCSNCARKFVLSYEPNPAYLRLCNGCCDKVSKGNQLRHPSKAKSKKDSSWSFSSWIGKSSSKKQYTSSLPKSSKQSQSYTNQLKHQAPLFPENYNMATPQRKQKQNMIFRQRISDDESDHTGPIKIFSEDDEDTHHDLFRTMHPLNNLKLKPPQSILSVSHNQVALNLSINKSETMHLVGNLEKTALCDCFSSSVKHDIESEDMNRFYRCATIPIIKHKTFKLLRVDLLFDDKEYSNWIGDNTDKFVSLNVTLYDHQSRMYSGVQMVNIMDSAPYQIIPHISVRCNQTLIKKSVTVVGSMAWKIRNDSLKNEGTLRNYPYESRTVSDMISVLSQQRFDIIESYDTVLQQRDQVKDQVNLEQADDGARKLYPVRYMAEEDGGSHIPTKTNESLNNPRQKQEGNALVSATCSSKRPGIIAQEMEKNMLQQEISRIESMISGLEAIISRINENPSAQSTMNNQPFDEIASSVTSSFMFNTNELNEAKSKIADHLNSNRSNPSKQHRSNKETEDEKKVVNCHQNASLPTIIPVCLSCQRCSRTIMLLEKTK